MHKKIITIGFIAMSLSACSTQQVIVAGVSTGVAVAKVPLKATEVVVGTAGGVVGGTVGGIVGGSVGAKYGKAAGQRAAKKVIP